MKTTIWEQGPFRILQVTDETATLEDLKGDCFNPACVDHISAEDLRKQELEFEALVEREGVFGFVLEKWNPEVGRGFEHVDSCFGFIGAYDEASLDFNHDIVTELKNQAWESV